MASKIEWTDETWNPIIGCSKASPGCKNCYAERMAIRQCFMRKDDNDYHKVVFHDPVDLPDRTGWNGKTAFVESALDKPLHWRKPRKIFVCSMGDLFHESVDFDWIDKVFAVMALCSHHTFQILTKRPERMVVYLNNRINYGNRGAHIGMRLRGCNTPWHTKAQYQAKSELGCAMQFHGKNWPLPNVWLGTSIEDQATADERIFHLLKCPAAVRFVSCEPLLGPVDINGYLDDPDGHFCCGGDAEFCRCMEDWPRDEDGWYTTLDWVICGGESGPKARPMHPDWVRSLRDQCKAADVPFMFKQWGDAYKRQPLFENPAPRETEHLRAGFIHSQPKGGHWLDGATHLAFPEVAK